MDFSELSGAGIKIGIIDSGYCPGRSRANIARGADFSRLDPEQVCRTPGADYRDEIGHGTACAGIIARKAPESLIYPVKIFAEELVADIEKLAAGITWCLENKVNLINLSLGVTEVSARPRLQELCDRAIDEKIFIVAAESNEGVVSYPASLSRVFGVGAGKVRGKYDYFFDDSQTIQFLARGDHQRLDWIDGKQVFMGGTSFAAPQITGIIALFLQRYPDIDYGELVAVLREHSLKERPPLAADPAIVQLRLPRPSLRLREVHQQGDIHWIKKALVYPYNKEMHALVRFRNLLPFEVAHVVDVVGRKTTGRDSGEVIGAEASGTVVHKRLEECLPDADTLVLGYLQEISRIKKRDVLAEVLQLALEQGKNVYSLSPVSEDRYPGLAEEFSRKGLRVGSPLITRADFERITQAFDWRETSGKPVIGVFGTSGQQGKFTAQLALRQELQQRGYRIGQLGTEHQSTLFGFDFTFPNGYDAVQNIRIPLDWHVPLLQSAMVGIEREDPHLIIVGGQSGLVPYSYAEKSQQYTLASLMLLMGTLPDAYILVVNSADEPEFIQEHLDALRILGKGETILLVFSDKKGNVSYRFGQSHVTYEAQTPEEIQETAAQLEERFGIPATEVVTAAGRQRMGSVVEDYFAAEGEKTAVEDGI
jgi:uncharacterized NAD-dependent epimerase/dehydratase family protein